MIANNDALNPIGIASIIYRTAIEPEKNNPNHSEFGYGVLNAFSAVKEAESKAGKTEKVIVKLIDPENMKEVKVMETDASSDYNFELENIQEGNYRIHAGYDIDGDKKCEKGEYWGKYTGKGEVFFVSKGQKLDNIVISLDLMTSGSSCPKEGS